jgi:hypothetical protein
MNFTSFKVYIYTKKSISDLFNKVSGLCPLIHENSEAIAYKSGPS